MSSDSGLSRMQQKCPTIASDWRSKDFRWKLFQRILNALRKLYPGEDSKKLTTVATNFEHKCFSTSSSQEEYVSKIQRKLTDMPNFQKSAAVDGNKNNFLPVQELTGPSVKKEEVEEKASVNLSIEQQLRKQHQPPIPVVNSRLLFPKEQASDIMQANAMRSHSKSIQKPVQPKVNRQEEYVSKIQRKITDMPNSQKSAAVDGNKNNFLPLQGPSVKKEEVEEKPSVNLSIEQQLRKQHQPPIPVVNSHLLSSKFPKEQASDIMQENDIRSHSKSIKMPVQSKVNKQVNQHSTCGMQHQSKLLQGHQNVPVDLKRQNQTHQQSLQRLSQVVKVKSESNAHPYVQSLSESLMHPQSQSQSFNLQLQRYSNPLQSSTLPQKQPILTKKVHLEASSSQVVLSTNNVTPLRGDEAEEVYQKLQSFGPCLPELQAFYYSTVRSLQQMASSFMAEQHSKYEIHKQMMNFLHNTIKCLMLSKDRVHPGLKEKLHEFDTKIPKIIALWRKMNDKSYQNIKPNVQGESTSMDSNTNLIHALQLPVEKLNNSPISSSQFSSNFSPQNDPSNAETPSPFTASTSSANDLNNSQTGLHTQSSASFTPGMHPSLLLDESTASETSQNKAAEAHVDELREKETPMDKLKRLIKSLSADTLSSAVTDIRGVVSLTDRLHGCNPNYMVGKNKACGKCEIREDLSLSAKCHVQSENVMPQYMVRKRKINRDITAVSHVHDGFDLRNDDVYTSEEKTTVSSSAKRQKCEINRSLQEEILKLNQKLFNTEVEIEENVADYGKVKLSAVGEGTFIKCSFTPITYSSEMKLLLSSSEFQIKPLSLHIPLSYPNGSPVLLNQLTDAELHEDNLNGKIQSKVERSIRCINHPASLGKIVSTWNSIVHDVIIESLGGCTFTSYYGSWQNTLSV